MISNPGTYMDQATSEATLRTACKTLGVSGYRMARLLGVGDNNYYAWYGGQRRPSAKYLGRLCWLLMFQVNRFPIFAVDSIDWDAGTVKYLAGVEHAPDDPRCTLDYWCGGDDDEAKVGEG